MFCIVCSSPLEILRRLIRSSISWYSDDAYLYSSTNTSCNERRNQLVLPPRFYRSKKLHEHFIVIIIRPQWCNGQNSMKVVIKNRLFWYNWVHKPASISTPLFLMARKWWRNSIYFIPTWHKRSWKDLIMNLFIILSQKLLI